MYHILWLTTYQRQYFALTPTKPLLITLKEKPSIFTPSMVSVPLSWTIVTITPQNDNTSPPPIYL